MGRHRGSQCVVDGAFLCSGSMSPEGEGSPRSRPREKSQRWGREDRADRPLQEVKRLKVEHRTEEDEVADVGERRALPTQTGSGVVVETQELPRGTGKTGEKAASSGAAASCGCSGRQEVMIQVMVLLLKYLTYSN